MNKEIADGIIGKLRRGIEKLAKDESPVLWCAPDGVNPRTETPGSIVQLGDNLWEDADKMEDTAHQKRLLSFFCRIYASKMGLESSREESKNVRKRKSRHDNGAAVLSWIVDGLYPVLKLKALLYYWAACS